VCPRPRWACSWGNRNGTCVATRICCNAPFACLCAVFYLWELLCNSHYKRSTSSVVHKTASRRFLDPKPKFLRRYTVRGSIDYGLNQAGLTALGSTNRSSSHLRVNSRENRSMDKDEGKTRCQIVKLDFRLFASFSSATWCKVILQSSWWFYKLSKWKQHLCWTCTSSISGWFMRASRSFCVGYSVCGHQVPCHRLTGALVRCNHPGDPKALNK
jgi:hypothetical protein